MHTHIHTYIIFIKYKQALDLHTYIHTHTRWAISGKQSIRSGAWVRLRVGGHVCAGPTWSNMRCFVGMYVCMYVCMYAYMHVCMVVCILTCRRLEEYVCKDIYLYTVCMYVCMN